MTSKATADQSSINHLKALEGLLNRLFWCGVIVMLLVGLLMKNNIVPIVGMILAAFVYYFSDGPYEAYVGYANRSLKDATPNHPVHDTLCKIAATGVAFVVMWASLYVFVPMPFFDYQLFEKRDGSIRAFEGWFMTYTNPLQEAVYNYDRSVDVGNAKVYCTLPPKDGHKAVYRIVDATLTLTPENLLVAHRAAGDWFNLKRMRNDAFCRQVDDIVLRIGPDLGSKIESQMIDDPGPINRLGLQYSGKLNIVRSSYDAYLDQTDKKH